MSVSFEGVGQVCATFLGGGLQEGQVVKVTEPGTVGPCGAGDGFCGTALCCKDDACMVQVAGFVTVGYTGTPPAVGYASLCADGTGGVKVSAGGRSRLVADVDKTAKAVTILL